MTAHCDVCVARTQEGYLVRVVGRGTSAHSPAFAGFVEGCLQHDPQAIIVVDLLTCDFLDSTFLGCLLKLQPSDSGSRFLVVADEDCRKRLFAATRLDRRLTVIPHAPKSIGRFRTLEAIGLSQRELGQHMMEAHQELATVESDFAADFGRIASLLQKDLEREDNRGDNLADTVILGTRNRG